MFHICCSLEEVKDSSITVFVVKEIRNNKICSIHFNTEWEQFTPSRSKIKYTKDNTEKVHRVVRSSLISRLLGKPKFVTKTFIVKKQTSLVVGQPMFGQGYHSFELIDDAIKYLEDCNTDCRNLQLYDAYIPVDSWLSKDNKRVYTKGDLYCSEVLVLNKPI